MGDMFEFRRASGRDSFGHGGLGRHFPACVRRPPGVSILEGWRKKESTRSACRNDGARPVVCPIQPIDYESVCPFPQR